VGVGAADDGHHMARQEDEVYETDRRRRQERRQRRRLPVVGIRSAYPAVTACAVDCASRSVAVPDDKTLPIDKGG
jgi:hypothetical protein